jgi:hypothetical protein
MICQLQNLFVIELVEQPLFNSMEHYNPKYFQQNYCKTTHLELYYKPSRGA